MGYQITGEPRQTCQTCSRYVVVVPSPRGFPPDTAAAKLRKLCLADGHESDPKYTAGFEIGRLVLTHEECREAGCLCHWLERVESGLTSMELDWVNPECPLHGDAHLQHGIGKDPNV